ncbi:hypothetical protein [Haloarcula rubripromontorii]|uniref:hypothetical protein n=1 Tax=Haloarcula rubripromontorii TaxID=1705562 RepID=UPI00345B5DA7
MVLGLALYILDRYKEPILFVVLAVLGLQLMGVPAIESITAAAMDVVNSVLSWLLDQVDLSLNSVLGVIRG